MSSTPDNAMTNVPPEEMPVARVYARAAWNLADREGKADELLEEYQALVTGLLDGEASIEKFFRAASVGREQRQAVLEKALAGRTSPLLYNFLITLNRHDRLGLTRAVFLALRELSDEAKGIVPVQVKSAAPLSDEDREEVKNIVRQRFQVEPRLHLEVQPSLLGGLWLRVGDVVLDRTLRTNLRKLRDSIRTRNVYEIQSGRDYFDSSGGN
jgi:F-type H+-transporting ATPase subunit delta